MLVRVSGFSVFGAQLIGLIGLAWVALVVGGQSPYGRFLDHKNLDLVRVEGGPALLFLGGWLLMIVAMMLPASLPLVALFHRMVRQRGDRSKLISLVLLGYVSVWTCFGIVVHASDALVHAQVASQVWLSDRVYLIGAATLLVAGAYQFTPLKYHCLDRCRSPLAFIVGRWRGRQPAGEAFRLGVAHGLFCVGCCWSLMLIMFAVGVGSIGWMLGLGAIMATEKNVSWGRRLSAPLGVLLLTGGLIAAFDAGKGIF